MTEKLPEKLKKLLPIVITIIAVSGLSVHYYLFFRTYTPPEAQTAPIGSFKGTIVDVSLFNVRYPFGITIPKTGVLEVRTIVPPSTRLNAEVSVNQKTKLLNGEGEIVEFSSLKDFFKKGMRVEMTGTYIDRFDGQGSRTLTIYASRVVAATTTPFAILQCYLTPFSKLDNRLCELINAWDYYEVAERYGEKIVEDDKVPVTIYFKKDYVVHEAVYEKYLEELKKFVDFREEYADPLAWLAHVSITRLPNLAESPLVETVQWGWKNETSAGQ